LGLAGRFLIHIKEASDLKSFPWLAIVGDESMADERRRRGWTRVHSLAMMACSTNVVGANTGILMPDQLPMEAGCAGLVREEAGDAASHDLWRRIVSHS
jgi:hypothetical protein